MNILILTPGRTASSALQRVLTAHMTFNGLEKPVVNLHDIFHGIDKETNPYLGVHALKSRGGIDEIFNDQPPSEIVELLSSANHFSVCRISFNALLYAFRNHTKEEMDTLYKYLNENFFIIRTERKSPLDFALSWIVADRSKKLNVTSHEEKDKTFKDVSGIVVEEKEFFSKLYMYKHYLEFTDEHFNIQAQYEYDDTIADMEDFILTLPLNFKKSWKDLFGMTLSEWFEHHNTNSSDESYLFAKTAIDTLVDMGILPAGMTVKLHSQHEKKATVANYDQCVEWYNSWKSWQ